MDSQASLQPGFDLSLYRFFSELFTPRLVTLVLPNLAVIVLIIIFLAGRGHSLYIIPAVAVLYGLLVISLGSLFFLKEFFSLGIWLAATGLLTLFTATAVHPTAALGVTFGAGFTLAALLLYLGPAGEKRPR